MTLRTVAACFAATVAALAAIAPAAAAGGGDSDSGGGGGGGGGGGKVVPRQAFLQPADMGGAAAEPQPPGLRVRFDLCGAPDPAGQVASAQFRWITALNGGTTTPQIWEQVIRRYADAGRARAAMVALHRAVGACPESVEGREKVRYRLVEGGAASSAFTVVRTVPARQGDGSPIPGRTTDYLEAFVRVGEAVTIVHDRGWENNGSAPVKHRLVVQRATARLKAVFGSRPLQ